MPKIKGVIENHPHENGQPELIPVNVNEEILMKQATSTGLKLNLDKLKIIPLNIPYNELDPEYFIQKRSLSHVNRIWSTKTLWRP